MAAASEGHLEIVKLLIASGADFTVKDARGRSVLWHAANHGHSRIVALLKELRAKGVPSTSGKNVLDMFRS
jgi:ankyrin repeat protein